MAETGEISISVIDEECLSNFSSVPKIQQSSNLILTEFWYGTPLFEKWGVSRECSVELRPDMAIVDIISCKYDML